MSSSVEARAGADWAEGTGKKAWCSRPMIAKTQIAHYYVRTDPQDSIGNIQQKLTNWTNHQERKQPCFFYIRTSSKFCHCIIITQPCTQFTIKGGTNLTQNCQVIGAQNLTIKVLILRLIVYSTFTVPLSLRCRCAKSSWWASPENCCIIGRLAANWHIPLNKTENIGEFCQSSSGPSPGISGFQV